jgi:two-component system, OmpR family, KDP operon response regulator KdpE
VILDTLAYNLTRQGFVAHKAPDGAEALKLTRKHRPDLILLDLMLPGQYDGIQVCQKIRRDDPNIVIIMITAKDAEGDKVKGFEAGADDYVTKPFGVDELLARLRAALRRVSDTAEPVIQIGELEIDLDKAAVRKNGELVRLTPNEFALLRLFAVNGGRLLTHRRILREVWGLAYQAESHYLHVYVSQLRRKIERDPARPRFLLTEPGAGYRLVDPKS